MAKNSEQSSTRVQLHEMTEVLDDLASLAMNEGLPLTSHLIAVAAESIRNGYGDEKVARSVSSVRASQNRIRK